MIKFIVQPIPLEGRVLLVNAISAGYVPTFAFDELIVTNGFRRIAFFQSNYLEPSVGYLPKEIEGGALGLPGELYENGDMLLLQFRSVLRFGRKKDFAKEIAIFVKENKIADVIVIGSLPHSIKPDLEIGALQKNIYYKIKGTPSSIVKVEKFKQSGHALPFEDLKEQDQEEDIILGSAGLSSALSKELQRVTILLMFNQRPQDHQTGKYFSTQLPTLLQTKGLSP